MLYEPDFAFFQFFDPPKAFKNALSEPQTIDF